MRQRILWPYGAFGEPAGHTGTSEQPYRFAGEHHDPEAQMQYHRARWYDPAAGRFASTDPFSGNHRNAVRRNS